MCVPWLLSVPWNLSSFLHLPFRELKGHLGNILRTWDSIAVAGEAKFPSINYPSVFQPHPQGVKLGADTWCQLFSESSSWEGLGLVGGYVALGCKACWSLSLLTWVQGRWPAPGTYVCWLQGQFPHLSQPVRLWQEKLCFPGVWDSPRVFLQAQKSHPHLKGGLAAPWFVSAFPWTISSPHLSVCFLECSFKICLNASNLILTQIYFSFWGNIQLTCWQQLCCPVWIFSSGLGFFWGVVFFGFLFLNCALNCLVSMPFFLPISAQHLLFQFWHSEGQHSWPGGVSPSQLWWSSVYHHLLFVGFDFFFFPLNGTL